MPPPPPDAPPLVAPLADRGVAGRVGSSAIRDLLRLTEQPGVISLAGGLPAAEALPAADIAAAAAEILAGPGAVAALQYGPTEGIAPLRDWIGRARGVPPDRVVVTHGAQQALDLVARALLRPGDPVVLAEPAYVGALQAVRAAGGRPLPVPADEGGLDVGALAALLRGGARPRLLYTVSELHNPTGATLAAERRPVLAGLAERYGFVVVDDDAYAPLRWEGGAPPPLRRYSDRVVTVGSFSKVLAPGLRVGHVVGPGAVMRDVVLLKQAADLHTGSLDQRIVHALVSRPGFLAARCERLRRLYAGRAGALADALDAVLGDRVRFRRPEGGLFLWVELPGVTDTAAMLDAALARGVAFVPGAAFAVAPGAGPSRWARLSHASLAPDDAARAARLLAGALDDVAGRR